MRPNELAAARRFHGHLGPWLVMGVRAGRYAARKLRGSPFELTAIVTCPKKPPVRCFIDGVQIGSGCTMGKANITHQPRNNTCAVRFVNRRTRCHLHLAVQPEIWKQLSTPTRTPLTRRARQIYQLPIHRLFIIKP